ncbi:MAG: TolC family protein [Planctomycetota bacterium]
MSIPKEWLNIRSNQHYHRCPATMKSIKSSRKTRLLLMLVALPVAWWGTRLVKRNVQGVDADVRSVAFHQDDPAADSRSGAEWLAGPQSEDAREDRKNRYLEFLLAATDETASRGDLPRGDRESTMSAASDATPKADPPKADPPKLDAPKSKPPTIRPPATQPRGEMLRPAPDRGVLDEAEVDKSAGGDLPAGESLDDPRDESPYGLTAPLVEPFQDKAEPFQDKSQPSREDLGTAQDKDVPTPDRQATRVPESPKKGGSETTGPDDEEEDSLPSQLKNPHALRGPENHSGNHERGVAPESLADDPGGPQENPFLRRQRDAAAGKHNGNRADRSVLEDSRRGANERDDNGPNVIDQDDNDRDDNELAPLPPPRRLKKLTPKRLDRRQPPTRRDSLADQGKSRLDDRGALLDGDSVSKVDSLLDGGVPVDVDDRADQAAPAWHLTLAEAIDIGLSNSPDVKAVRYAPLINEAVAGVELGEFDPVGGVSLFGGQDDRLARSLVDTFAAPVDFRDSDFFTPVNGLNNFFVRQRLKRGATYEFGYGTDYQRFDPAGLDLLFPSGWEASINFQFTQPLLRGRGKAANLRRYYLALAQSEETGYEAQARTRELVRNIELAYWELSAAFARVKVAEQYVKLGIDFERQEAERKDLGISAMPQQLQTQTLLADFNVALRLAQRDTNIAEKRLRTAMGIAAMYPAGCGSLDMPPQVYELPIRPMIEASVQPVAMDLDAAVAHAMNRPVFGIIQARIHGARHNLAAARNALLPQLDATAVYRKTGLDKGLDDANSSLFNRRFDTWGVGVTYQQSAYQRSARNAIRRFELTIAEEETRAEALANQIAGDLSRFKADVEGSYQTFLARRKQVNYLRQFVDALNELYLDDKVSLFQRLEITRALQASEVESVEAWGLMQTATARYRFERGDVPADYGVPGGPFGPN